LPLGNRTAKATTITKATLSIRYRSNETAKNEKTGILRKDQQRT